MEKDFSTDWLEIRRASDIASAEGGVALISLINRYSPALKAYLAGRFHLDPHELEDVYQAFIERKILGERIVARADQSRGSFRGFLLSALHRFYLSEIRQRQSQKRSPGHKLVNLDDVPEASGPDEDLTEQSGEAIWAQAVIAGALLDMHNELVHNGRMDTWEVFLGRVLLPLLHDETPIPYDLLVQRFGFKSPSQALNTLVTAKRMFRRHVKAVIARYTGDGPVAEEELAHLQWVLRHTRAR